METKQEIKNIFNLNPIEFIKYLKTCDLTIWNSIIEYKEITLNTNINIFNTLFLNAPFNIKAKMFNDLDYLKRITQIPNNRFGKTFFDLLTEEEKTEFLKNKNLLDKIDKNLFNQFIKKLDTKQLDINSKVLNNQNIDELFIELEKIAKISPDLKQSIISKINSKTRNSFKYMKVNNDSELFIYNKFNLNLKVEKDEENKDLLYFGHDHIIDKKYLEKINEKHMNIIIQKILKDNEINEKEYYKVFITSLKMYEIFGFDNTMKILNNKFTNMNYNSLKKYAELYFIDQRREYRLKNQQMFYSYEMLQKTKEALKSNNLYYFCDICQNNDDNYLISFFKNLQKQISEHKDFEDEIIIEIIKDEIKKREKTIKQKFIDDYIHKFNQKKFLERKPFDYKELYNIFSNISIDSKLDNKGRIIPDVELKQFLLGNEKNNNDCLFRLIVNKKAFGLKLSTLINSFHEIKQIISLKTNNLSLYSILDVIDVCKSVLYQIAPNEQDMTLETITKIQNSTQYCSEPKEVIFKRAKKLHIERRKKISSTIPTVQGKYKDIKYQVLNFDNPNLITCGIDTGSCLKVGGKGEEFLRYCMTSPNAVIISMIDNENNIYICPYIRNGNGIYGNGIDPKPENEAKAINLLEALKKCTKEIMEKSIDKEKIEFSTITDLHQKNFFEKSNLKTIPITKKLAIESEFYADYHKEDKKSYLISFLDSFKKPVLYNPKIEYKQDRLSNYIYNSEMDKDKERIELLINSIKYTSIDFQNKIKSIQEHKKREYKPYKIDDFEYIVGNKDWFIALNKNLEIISELLPYDDRAYQEFIEALISLKQTYQIAIEGKYK